MQPVSIIPDLKSTIKKMHVRVREDYSKKLNQVGDVTSLDQLVALIYDRKPLRIRRAAADLLSQLDTEEAIEAAMKIFQDEKLSPTLRISASYILIGSPHAGKYKNQLILDLSNKNQRIKACSVYLLGWVKEDSDAENALLDIVSKHSENEIVLARAISSLLNLESKSVVAILLETFNFLSPLAQVIALQTIASLGTSDDLAALKDRIPSRVNVNNPWEKRTVSLQEAYEEALQYTIFNEHWEL